MKSSVISIAEHASKPYLSPDLASFEPGMPRRSTAMILSTVVLLFGSSNTLCWERDVLPVVRVDCAPCHLAGSPMTRLDSLPLVLRREAKWQAYLASGHMPPAGPLPPETSRRLVDWMKSGGPRCEP